MTEPYQPRSDKVTARERILVAATDMIRAKGYSATAVDELCAKAGVTKGAFFHHFASKSAMAEAAIDHWSRSTSALFATVDYHAHPDPLDRVLGYIDFRLALLEGPVEAFTCLAGTLLQEVYASDPNIRQGCEASILDHAKTLEADIALALVDRRLQGVSARSLALHTQVVLQGAFILAKATGGPALARQSVIHLRRYFELLFWTKHMSPPDAVH